MSTKFVTKGQGAIIEMARALTDSPGFMEDARAIAAYQDGFEGNPDYIKAVIVFEGFRPNRSAEMHFGMAFGKAITLEIIQMGVTVAFHPKLFNLDQVITKTPVENVKAICALLKIGFQIQHRERAALANGGDVIVSTLSRQDVLAQVNRHEPEIMKTE